MKRRGISWGSAKPIGCNGAKRFGGAAERNCCEGECFRRESILDELACRAVRRLAAGRNGVKMEGSARSGGKRWTPKRSVPGTGCAKKSEKTRRLCCADWQIPRSDFPGKPIPPQHAASNP